MEHFEKLGAFYLGRPYDVAGSKPQEGYLLYDSKDLVTHGVCVGMTGSGKTGLCVAMLEEAAMDGIPAIVIDPKGDMTNLLLAFPDLKAADFRPWINEDDAGKMGMSPDEYAGQQAELWRKGLASWGQDGERIRQMQQHADFKIYTPGSTAGTPVSILQSFAAPPPAILADSELLQDQVAGTAASLLGLAGLDADPLRSREHILLSTILLQAWQSGQNLDLAELIRLIQDPPVRQIGVMDLESFYPAKDRFALALLFNNLLASPGFAAWLQGEELDVGSILHTPGGKPRIAIFSIAHLGDAERIFFVSLLLNQVLGWIRTQSGTTSLRAILYMDEIFGFFPPVENPPTKKPLLTLLKQARAYGLGIMLTTQNPVDLDYKGLANTGTWFIGRLQTERDKLRVLEGLEGASAAQGAGFDRARMEQVLAGLGKRIFLMHNVHDDQPTIFETRWCMSYLRGPLTRSQIQLLKNGQPASPADNSTISPAVGSVELRQPAPTALPGAPVLAKEIRQYYLPWRGQVPEPASLLYKPAVLGISLIGFRDAKTGLQVEREKGYTTEMKEGVFAVDWGQAQELELALGDLETEGLAGARYAGLPAAASDVKNYTVWSRDFAAWIYRTQQLELMQCPAMKTVSMPGESERDFRIRLQQSTRESRDEVMAKLKQKYAVKINALEEKIRRSEQAVEREKDQAKQQKVQTAISFGATILSSFLGKKRISASSLGRATTAIRGASRTMKEKGDVDRSLDTVEAYKQQLQEQDEQFRAEADSLGAQLDPANLELNPYVVRPAKSDILVKALVLVWLPYRQSSDGTSEPAWKELEK